MEIVLNKESVEAYKELMQRPKENGLDFPPLSDVFEVSEAATAKHILFEQYIALIKKPLPKIFFYIIMDELYKKDLAPDGNLGYCVTFKK